MPKHHHLSFILNHLGENRTEYYNAVSPPIIQTSNFAFPDLAQFREAFASEYDNHVYSRGNNPTVAILRKKLAALEGTEDALVCGSGSGAVAAAVMSQVNAGDHVVCVDTPYSWTKKLLSNYLVRFGVSTTYVDGTSMEAIEQAIQPNTTLLYLESPNSLTFEIQDIAACAALAKKHGLTTIIDNSYASPLHQQPAQLGIDIMVHSGSKYLNGHSDVVVGVICGSRQHLRRIFEQEYMTLGSVIGPHEAGLVLRGLRTLELRIKRCDQSARILAERLQAHEKAAQVLHPLLPSFPQYELARRQLSGTGGLLSVYFRTDEQAKMEAFVDRMINPTHDKARFTLAVSWGGHESLALPIVGFYDIPGQDQPLHPWNLVRFYIGLEDPEWLWEGLDWAMEAL